MKVSQRLSWSSLAWTYRNVAIPKEKITRMIINIESGKSPILLFLISKNVTMKNEGIK